MNYANAPPRALFFAPDSRTQVSVPFPKSLLPLRLLKRRMWLWQVVPGLYDAELTILKTNT